MRTALRGVHDALGIAAVTGMHEDNPGVDLFRKRVRIVRSGRTGRSMEDDLTRLATVGLKLANGTPLGPAREEGYFATGIVQNTLTRSRAVDRAVSMLLRKVSGEPFQTEMSIPRYEP